jgi:hypothetical protein
MRNLYSGTKGHAVSVGRAGAAAVLAIERPIVHGSGCVGRHRTLTRDPSLQYAYELNHNQRQRLQVNTDPGCYCLLISLSTISLWSFSAVQYGGFAMANRCRCINGSTPPHILKRIA